MSQTTDSVRFHGPGFRSPPPVAGDPGTIVPEQPTTESSRHEHLMVLALDAASNVRGTTSPNPPVGAAIALQDGTVHTGATQPPGGAHAEIMAMRAATDAGGDLRGATVATTLEPCSHTGRTGPCADALIEAGVGCVVVGLVDPDPLVAGNGVARLRAAGVDVHTDVLADTVAMQLAAYLTHRRTGRPHVVLKLAATLDGGTAAPDRSSQWITGADARRDAHRLRAESDAILVGAGTVRDDDPSLTVREIADDDPLVGQQPLRFVLGTAPDEAKIHPCEAVSGDLGTVLDDLGQRGVLQLMVEGGASVAGDFHRQGLVDHYVIYLAPALFGGETHRGLFTGDGAPTMGDLWRGRIHAVTRLGDDIRVDLGPVDLGAATNNTSTSKQGSTPCSPA